MNVYGELFRAQLENLSSAPSTGVAGRVWYRSDLYGGTAQLENGSAVKQFLLNDQYIIIGTSGTAATNVRTYRSGTGKLAFVLGSDSTAEGTDGPPGSLAQLSFVLDTDTYANLSAKTRKAGVLYWASDALAPMYDDGTDLNNLSPSQSNVLINGNFDYWQRNTSVASVATDTYVADRWMYLLSTTTAVHTYSRNTDVPTLAESGFASTYSLHLNCTTADGSVDAGDLIVVMQKIEGFNWANVIGKTVTLSFWVKATKTGTSCVAIKAEPSYLRSYIAEFTINTTATWEKKTVTLTVNPSTSSPNYTTGIGGAVSFVLMAGSNYQTSADSWQNNNYYATANQVNHCDNTSNTFQVAQVMLSVGGPAPFRRAANSIAGELVLCQRYYEKSYDIDTSPTTATANGSYRGRSSSTGDVQGVHFTVKKRTAPSVNLYSTVTGTIAYWRDVNAAADRAAVASDIGESNCAVTLTATVDQAQFAGHWTASAEL